MGFKDIVGGIAGAISAPLTAWINHSGERAEIAAKGATEIKRAEIERDLAEAKAQANLDQTAQDNDQAWDMMQAQAAQHSLKDDLWTLLVITIIAMCFVPGGAERATAGFDALNHAPIWFWAIVGASVAFSFGIRKAFQLIALGKGK